MREFFTLLRELLAPATRQRLRRAAWALVIVALLEGAGMAMVIPLMSILTSAEGGAAGTGWAQGLVSDLGEDRVAALLGIGILLTFTTKSICAIWMLRRNIQTVLEDEAAVSGNLLDAYLRVPYEDRLLAHSSDVQRTVVQSARTVYQGTIPWVLGAASDATSLLAIATVLALADPLVALVTLLYFAGFGVVYQRAVHRRSRRAADAVHKGTAAVIRSVAEPAAAHKEIAVLGREHYFASRLTQEKLSLVGPQRTIVLLSQAPRYLLELAFVVGAAFVAVTAFSIRPHDAALATVGLFLAAGLRLLPTVTRALVGTTVIRTSLPSLRQLVADMPSKDSLPEPPDAWSPRPTWELQLREVSYRYPHTDRPACIDVDLLVRQGEHVGLVGASGSGKTTLLDIVLGLLQPTSGSVTVDGQPMQDVLGSWRRFVGYVPQEVVLIDDTLDANVAFGLPAEERDLDLVATCLALAELQPFVDVLPDGLGTRLGEAGGRLSGGQRQRIGIARALYTQPAVLVFDEATSALDGETEASLGATIECLRGEHTIITVSHRLNNVRGCDRIYVLDDGRVLASGSFSELERSVPSFARVVEFTAARVTARTA